MQVTVYYFGQLRRAAGRSKETVSIEAGARLAHLVERLAAARDFALRALLLDDGGQPQRTLLYAVGDHQTDTDHPLRDGDVVTLLTPMAGG